MALMSRHGRKTRLGAMHANNDMQHEFAPRLGTSSLVFNDRSAHTLVRRLLMGALTQGAGVCMKAGVATTAQLIGNGMHVLLQLPQQLQATVAGPTLQPTAVEALLRCESPLPLNNRLLTAPAAAGLSRPLVPLRSATCPTCC